MLQRASQRYRSLQALVCALLLTGAFSGCAEYRACQKCGCRGCPGDAHITAQVRALLDEHTELKAPNQVYVRTLDGVVYLSGEVATDLQRETAEELAREAPGVRRVADLISLEYGGR
jgi:osmotically-inducible protein OsmY